MTWPRPSPAALRHAVRMTVAALLASELTAFFNLPQGYWAVITTLIIMQGSLGGTFGAATDRVLATMAGACLGVVGAWLQTTLSLPPSLVLVMSSAPLAMLAVQRPSFRLAPVTAAMILMMGGSESGALWTALDRMFEIALGCIIGVVTAQVVFPSRARPMILQSAASLLQTFGKLAQAHLTNSDQEQIEALNAQVRQVVTRIATATAEQGRERAIHFTAEPDTAPLLRTLRRLRSDVAILGRVMAISNASPEDHAAVADVVKACFDQAAAFLRHQGEAPTLDGLDAIIGEMPEAGTLHFALITLRRDLAELGERLSEQMPAEQNK